MKPQTFTWKKLAADELTRVYLDEMRRDFPPSELKPLSMILNSEAAGMAHTWGVFEGEMLVSYLLMVQPMGCEVSQLDYFSVLPAYRSTGIGAKLLAALPALRRAAALLLLLALLRLGRLGGGSALSADLRRAPPARLARALRLRVGLLAAALLAAVAAALLAAALRRLLTAAARAAHGTRIGQLVLPGQLRRGAEQR